MLKLQASLHHGLVQAMGIYGHKFVCIIGLGSPKVEAVLPHFWLVANQRITM